MLVDYFYTTVAVSGDNDTTDKTYKPKNPPQLSEEEDDDDLEDGDEPTTTVAVLIYRSRSLRLTGTDYQGEKRKRKVVTVNGKAPAPKKKVCTLITLIYRRFLNSFSRRRKLRLQARLPRRSTLSN